MREGSPAKSGRRSDCRDNAGIESVRLLIAVVLRHLLVCFRLFLDGIDSNSKCFSFFTASGMRASEQKGSQ